MSTVHAERAPGALMDPTDPWGTLGTHVVAAKGARGARVGGYGANTVTVWGVGGALTRHVTHVCSTGVQRDPYCGPLERVRMLLSVKWRISQLVERDIIRLREGRGHQAHAPNPLQCGQRPRHDRHVRGCHSPLTSNLAR